MKHTAKLDFLKLNGDMMVCLVIAYQKGSFKMFLFGLDELWLRGRSSGHLMLVISPSCSKPG